MRPRAKPGFLLVARRELRWLLHDRVALVLMFGVPLFAFVALAVVFSHPVIRGLGVVVVDADRSDTSRALVEQVAASPNLRITARAGDLASAASAIRSGEAIAAVFIPANFERDVKAERRPQVVAFYNQQYLTAAGIASSGLSDSLAAAEARAASAAQAAPKAARVGSLVAETIVLVNPQKNYAQFLLRTLLPMIIHVVIALAGGYAVGSEFRRRSVRTWLACAGGNPIVALAGKLAPLFAIFFLIMLAEPLVLEGLLDIQFKGDVLMMIAAASLLIIAYLALAALLQLLLCDLPSGLGLTGIVVSPAFGYAGVGFPILGMNAFAHAWSAILPVRWYMAVLLGQAAHGLPVTDSAEPFAALAALAALYVVLALLRMRAVSGRLSRGTAAANEVVLPADRPGVAGAFAGEWRRVLAIRGAFIVLIGAPLVYGVYYPQPYLNQILRKLPIVVVDSDQTELARRIVETLDASGAVSVVARARTLADARALIDRGDAFAAVGIPPDTERDVLKGITAHIPIYADATYLFIFRSMSSGIAVAINTLSAELAAGGARPDGSLAKASLAASSPGDALLQPIFNPVGGYASYIVPAAFLLILQQTLLIGSALLTGVALAQGTGGALASVLGRGIAHLTIYLPALALYLIVLPQVYGFSTLGDPLQLLALGSVFLLATSFMGQAAGAWFKRPETPTLIFLGTSLPQFFMIGFAWPREAIPPAALAAGQVFPVNFAVNGIVRINQLGASLAEVVQDWRGLWLLAAVYFVLAAVSVDVVRRRGRRGHA
jgi:ABC-2 type transport system permease protein